MADFELPVAFHFSVSIGGSSGEGEDAAFQEVSGLDSEIAVEEVAEGGENRFVHSLPKPVKHKNLTLKRGLLGSASSLAKWCKNTFESDFSKAIEPKDVTVSLLDSEGDPAASWAIGNAWPVKWSPGGFNAEKNAIAIETIELAYNTLKRTA